MILVATEDRLSEAVAAKIVTTTVGSDTVMRLIRGGGNGYLRKRFPKLVEASKTFPLILLTDLDRVKCAPMLLENWTGGKKLPEKLRFRVAVREVETWLLADRKGMANLLAISPQTIEPDPECIVDPKRYLVNLAAKAPRSVRDDILPSKGSSAARGFGYNDCLCRFVANNWSPRRAAEVSRSLRKAIDRISELRAVAH